MSGNSCWSTALCRRSVVLTQLTSTLYRTDVNAGKGYGKFKMRVSLTERNKVLVLGGPFCGSTMFDSPGSILELHSLVAGSVAVVARDRSILSILAYYSAARYKAPWLWQTMGPASFSKLLCHSRDARVSGDTIIKPELTTVSAHPSSGVDDSRIRKDPLASISTSYNKCRRSAS